MATKGTLIHIDFIPDYSINDIVEYWAKTSDYNPKIQLGHSNGWKVKYKDYSSYAWKSMYKI